jgi:hypothetical protein
VGNPLEWAAKTAAAALTLWVCATIGVCLAIALFSATRSWFGQIIDWHWDPANLNKHKAEVKAYNENPANKGKPQRKVITKIRWRRARTQQYVAKGVGIPMGLGLIAIMMFQLMYGITFAVYAWGVIVWFCTAPLRYYLTMRTSVALNKQRYADHTKHPEEFGPAEPIELTAWQLTLKHYRWALRTPASDKHQVTVAYRRWLWLNNVASWVVNFGKLGWLWHIWTMIVILIHAGLALVWPVAYIGSMIYAIIEAGEARPTTYQHDKFKVKPWWISSKVSEPDSRVKPKHAVPQDTAKSLAKS